jgi:hypothetical protein
VFRGIALLRYLPGNFEILPLYCLLLLPLPLVLVLASVVRSLRERMFISRSEMSTLQSVSRSEMSPSESITRSEMSTLGIAVLLPSLALYLAVQLLPARLDLPADWNRVWLFNPWAWQFPFYLGVAVGVDARLRRFLFSNRLPVVVLALVLLEVAFLVKVLPHEWRVPFTGKANCEPLRMVHFWALVVVGRAFLPRDFGPLARTLASPLTLCGRNALATYCVGGVLSTVGSLTLAAAGYNWPAQITVNALGWLGCLAAAAVSEIGKARWNTPR